MWAEKQADGSHLLGLDDAAHERAALQVLAWAHAHRVQLDLSVRAISTWTTQLGATGLRHLVYDALRGTLAIQLPRL